MNISPQTIRQGKEVQKELASNPSTFGSDNGVTHRANSGDLDTKYNHRMAGPMGARALELMNPNEAMKTNTWMEQFGMSNQGSQFNQAKEMQAQQQADQAAGVVG